MSRPYYGWSIVGVAALINAVLTGTMYASFGVFFVPVSSELHLSRAQMSMALALQSIGCALLAPLVGRLLDRARAKYVMLACAGVFAVSYSLVGLVHSLILVAILLTVAFPVAYLGGGSLSNTLLVTRWFTRRRGRALQLAGLGIYLGAMIVPLGVQALIAAWGWRSAVVIIGSTMGLVLALLAAIVNDRPAPGEAEVPPDGHGSASTPSTAAQAPLAFGELLRMPYFWAVTLAVSVGVADSQAFTATLVPLGRDAGLSAMEAAGLMSVMGAAALIGGFAFSTVADKIDRLWYLTATLLVLASIDATLWANQSHAALLICAGAVGVCNATLLNVFYALLADRFGAARFGTVRGAAFFVYGTLSIVAIRFSGEVFDRTGTYKLMFLILSACLVAAALLMSVVRNGWRAWERLGICPAIP